MAELGVLHDLEFIHGTGGSRYIKEYVDNEEKVYQEERESFRQQAEFLDYMDDMKKTSGLFSSNLTYLTEEERNQVTSDVDHAQEKGSVMWRDLFSFDDDWLIKYGLMQADTRQVDEKRIMRAIKSAMDVANEQERYQGHVWVAAMHHNTAHVHVHVTSVERQPSRKWAWFKEYKTNAFGRAIRDAKGNRMLTGREVYQPRGSRKYSTLLEMKSVFVNQLIQSAEQLQQLDVLARQELLHPFREHVQQPDQSEEQKHLLAAIFLKLPKDKRLWNMKNARKNFFGNEVDAYVTHTVKEQFQEKETAWQQALRHVSLEYQEAYETTRLMGDDGYVPKIRNYHEKKAEELYQRLGNAVLSELRGWDKERAEQGVNRKAYLEAQGFLNPPPKKEQVPSPAVRAVYEGTKQQEKEGMQEPVVAAEMDQWFAQEPPTEGYVPFEDELAFLSDIDQGTAVEAPTFENSPSKKEALVSEASATEPVMDESHYLFASEPPEVMEDQTMEELSFLSDLEEPRMTEAVDFENLPSKKEPMDAMTQPEEFGYAMDQLLADGPPEDMGQDMDEAVAFLSSFDPSIPIEAPDFQNPPSKKGTADVEAFQASSTDMASLFHSEPPEQPTSGYIDASLWGLEPPEGVPAQVGQNPPSKKDQSGKYHMVNVYTEDGKRTRILILKEVSRAQAQEKFREGLTNQQARRVKGKDFLAQRGKGRPVISMLHAMEKRMRNTKEKWERDMAYERLQSEIERGQQH
ncbi:hypothetical protein EP56_01805 [Listeriaceae bacterium FSL A5-0209]|nr:hypothetical protein EP56_01805 [Listeriaceae bacterium FSL A5-0209]